MSVQELTFKISATDAGLKSVMAQARAEIAATAKVQQSVNKANVSSLDKVSEAMQALRTSTASLGGPLGSLSGQLGSMGSALASLSTSATGATSGIAAMAGPIGIATAAMAGMATASVLLVKGLFDLAKSSAEWRGALFDTSQQLGISTETLSALEILAKTTGSSLDGITASLGIFQKKLEEAQDPTSKEAKLLKELGVETENTEDALRQTLVALAAMPAGFHQTATALEVFGRGGKSMLAILKEMDGDLDGAIAKFREMGLVVSQEDAKAADEFNDQLALLGFEIRALVGKEAIPAALVALKDLSKVLKDNKEAFEALGFVIGVVSTQVGSDFRESIALLTATWTLARGPLDQAAAAYRAVGDAIRYVTGSINKLSTLNPTAGIGGQFAGEFGGGLDPTEATRAHQPRGVGGGGTGRTRASSTSSETEAERATKRRLDYTLKLNDALKELRDELRDVATNTRSYAVEQEILNGILQDASPEMQEQARIVAKSIDNSTTQLRIQKELRAFLVDQIEAVRLATEGEKGLLTQTIEQIAAWEKEGAVLQEVTKRTLINNAAILASVEARKMYMDLAAVEVAGAANAGLSDDEIGARAGAAANELLGEPPPVDPWIEAFAQLKFAGEDAFGALAQGIGSLIQNWVIMGTVGPQAMRKVVASVLSGVAAQAAVMAIMELAYGLAALTPWGAAVYGPAPFHFKSAAMFGAVAVAAAVGGRLAAGDAFQNAAGGGGGGGGSSSSTPGTTKPPPVDVNRRNFNTQKEVLEIRFTGQLGDVIEHQWIDRYNGGGRLRNVVKNDGQG